jgi:predicted nucleotidyltransferase
MRILQYPLINNKKLTGVKENILATVTYFDMFDYPLTGTEIYLFLKGKCALEDFDEALKHLVGEGLLFRFEKYYTLKNDARLIARRRDGNAKAVELITIAGKISELLIRFPFVRGIAISGSLSKNFADDDSDIDLFIITAKNRLWIARTLMHAFKKLTFLVNRQDYFCMNYYIDEQELEIIEKNIYTAIEVVTLIPLQGDNAFEQFYAANLWTQCYLPNKIMRLSSARPMKNSFLKRFFERLLNYAGGSALDNMLMKITAARWFKKTQANQVNSKGSVMAMDAGRHYSKPHAGNFQAKLLRQYEDNLVKVLISTQKNLVH